MYNILPRQTKALVLLLCTLFFTIVSFATYSYIQHVNDKSQIIKEIDLSLPQMNWTIYEMLNKSGSDKDQNKNSN